MYYTSRWHQHIQVWKTCWCYQFYIMLSIFVFQQLDERFAVLCFPVHFSSESFEIYIDFLYLFIATFFSSQIILKYKTRKKSTDYYQPENINISINQTFKRYHITYCFTKDIQPAHIFSWIYPKEKNVWTKTVLNFLK